MEYSPPPLFKQGAPARVKVTVFACISMALLVLDARMHMLDLVRQGAATVLYPLQMLALVPRDASANMGNYFSTLSSLQKQVQQLKSEQVASAHLIQQARLQMAENAQLRKLMGAREHLPVKSMMSEILYDARDPAARKVVLDRGTRQGVSLGLPVIDNAGVVGQVTRVFPLTAEVTLLTDREQAIPVQVLRNGLRSVAYGRGQAGLLDLRFIAPNADIVVGDVLITSGMDGVYPAGLAVAKVVQVESNAGGVFGRVVCQPLAGIDRNRQLLILMGEPNALPRPPAEAPKVVGKKGALPKMAPLEHVAPLPPKAEAPAAAGKAETAPGKPAAPTTAPAVKSPAPAPAKAAAPTAARAGAAGAANPPAQPLAAGAANTAPAVNKAPATVPANGATTAAAKAPTTVANPPAATLKPPAGVAGK